MKPGFYKAIVFIHLLFLAFFTTHSISGQEVKPQIKNFKNSVKINITNPMIFGDECFMFGYERTIGTHQSFQVNIGRFSILQSFSINTDSIKQASNSTNNSGFHLSGDYRFFLLKENKYNSPRGVYIGPYVTYNSASRDFNLTSNTQAYTGEFNTNFNFTVASAGFQLGYQFIFWNRVSLDMILFGPGIAAYKMKTEISTTLDPDQESQLFQEINDALKEKIPGYDLVPNPGSFINTGTFKTTAMGFRYVVMLGVRF